MLSGIKKVMGCSRSRCRRNRAKVHAAPCSCENPSAPNPNVTITAESIELPVMLQPKEQKVLEDVKLKRYILDSTPTRRRRRKKSKRPVVVTSSTESGQDAGEPGSSYIYDPKTMESADGILKAGTLLMSTEPFAYILCDEHSRMRCGTCFKRLPVYGYHQLCFGCMGAHYCNKGCQEKGYAEGHKYECASLKWTTRKGVDRRINWNTTRLLLRVIGRLQDESAAPGKDLVGPGQYRTFKNLLSHAADLKKGVTNQNYNDYLFKQLKYLAKENNMVEIPPFPQFITIMGRISINTFAIYDEQFGNIGIGLYLGASIFNHSCRPMVTVSFVETRICVRNLVDIPADLPLSELTVEYTDIMSSRSRRRAILRENYYFECECERCHVEIGEEDPELDLVKCPFCPAELSVIFHDDCPGCKAEVTEEFRNRILKIENKVTRIFYSECKQISLKHAGTPEQLMAEMIAKHFSKLHSLVLQAAIVNFDNSFEDMKFKEAYYYGNIWLAGLRSRLRPTHNALGRHLIRMAQVCYFMDSVEEGLIFASEGLQIMEICEGSDSMQIQYLRDRIGRVQEKAYQQNLGWQSRSESED